MQAAPEPPPPEPARPLSRRLPPSLVAVMVVVLVAAALVAVALRSGGDGEGGELGAGDVPASTTTPEPPPPTTTTTTGPPIPPAQQRVFDELMAQVAEVRGLQWREPLNLRVVSPRELARRVREVIARDADPAQLAGEEATLKLLGLIPDSLDYEQLVEDLLAEQVLGFYDPETRELFVGGVEGTVDLDPATKYVIVHEMEHALADQVFNFGPATIALDKADKAEELAAYSALLEGDAILLQELWAERHLSPLEQLAALFGGGDGGVSVLLNAPQYIREALFFPYTDGRTFVRSLYEAGGWAAVDAAYRRPPTSTEHILNPATYRAGESASPPPMPDVAAASGCTPLRTGTIGQFDMRATLDQHLTNNEAMRAVQGWNGDAFTLVRCGDSLAMAARWQTDPGTDPSALVNALNRWAPQWAGGGQPPGPDGRFSGPEGAGRIARSGSRVDFVLAEDAGAADRLVGALG